MALSLSDCSPTLRWPRQAAASRRSSLRSWKRFSQTECSRRPRPTPTAMNTTRPTEPLRMVSPGRSGGSSATGRGRGDTLWSRGDSTSDLRWRECSHNLHKYAVFVCTLCFYWAASGAITVSPSCSAAERLNEKRIVPANFSWSECVKMTVKKSLGYILQHIRRKVCWAASASTKLQ